MTTLESFLIAPSVIVEKQTVLPAPVAATNRMLTIPWEMSLLPAEMPSA